MKKFCILLLTLFLANILFGINISTKLDTINTNIYKIYVGDRIYFNVIFEHKSNKNIKFYDEIESEFFEILEVKKSISKNEDIQITNFKFESAVFFDIGEQIIPQMKFNIIDNEDTLEMFSDSIIIDIKSIVDTENPQLKDIKNPISINFTFLEYFLPILFLVIIIAIIIIIVKKRKNEPIFPKKEEKKIPAHIIALEKIKELKRKKLLDNKKMKEYYTEISWICREYLENRFGFPFLEFTGFEIRQILKKHNIENKSKFQNILKNCDKVKYAKYIPQQKNSEKLITDLENVINDTKIDTENNDRIS